MRAIVAQATYFGARITRNTIILLGNYLDLFVIVMPEN